MRVTIHQPEFAPWLGFFHKVSLADRLILLPDVQFRKNYFHNRNQIRTAQGAAWITVPIEHLGLSTPINQVPIAWKAQPDWQERLLRAVRSAYQRASYFDETFQGFSKIIGQAEQSLVSLNIPLLKWMLESFGLHPEIRLSSEWHVPEAGSGRILQLCLESAATTYLSGVSGREYLDRDAFRRAGIQVEFQEFHHPIYPQLHAPFHSKISALEALFLFGPHAGRLLEAAWPEKIEGIFA